MRIVAHELGAAAPVQQVPRHSEVDQQNSTGIESDNQILASAIDGGDSLPFQLDGHTGGVERAGETRIEDIDALQAPAHECRLESCADGLDLGQLGHLPSVAASRRVTASGG
jgi:hypothetical protein